MSGNGSTGGSTPRSATFDPGASAFVPTRKPHAKGDTPASLLKMNTSSQGSLIAPQCTRSTAKKPARLPLPLYSSPTWSPITEQPIKSATIPPKPSWDSFLDRRASLHPDSSLLSPGYPHINSTTKGDQPDSPYPRFDITGNGLTYMRGEHGQISGAKTSPGLSGLRYTQTEQYHAEGSDPKPNVKPNTKVLPYSDPLPQHPFGWPNRMAATSSSGGSAFSQNQNVPNTPHSASTQGVVSSTEQRSFEDQQSEGSGSVTISDHYTQTHPEQAGAKGEVWQEKSHPHSIRRALKDGSVEWIEAYQGAVQVLSAMNPGVYQMPFGTRVINIKTDFPRNVLKSITCGKYSVMPRVAERIMKIWNSRENPSEKVLFLFSINGSKRFTGIAEMSGSWVENDFIEGWENSHDSSPASGTFSVTWVYVKDVAYHQFNHIRQPNNGHPVGNMWNGMNFPSDTGRQVVQIYVETPATSSILGQPKVYHEQQMLMPSSYRPNHDQRRGNPPSIRGPRGGRGALRAGPACVPNWGHHDNVQLGNDFDDDATPVANHRSNMPTTNNASSTLATVAATSKPPRTDQLFTVDVNEQGQLVLVPAEASRQVDDGQLSAAKNTSSGKFKSTTQHVATVPTVQAENGAVFDSMGRALHGSRSDGNMHHSASSSATTRLLDLSHLTSPLPRVAPTEGNIQHFPVLPPQPGVGGNTFYQPNVPYGTSGFLHSYGDETPTHRPPPHAGRNVAHPDSKQPHMADVPLKDLGENLLKAKYHLLAVEQYTLSDQLCEPGLSDMAARLNNAKMARVLTEKRQVLAQLAANGIPNIETLSPIRRDSFASADQVTVSPGDEISPLRAEDGRRLRSVSKVDSPANVADPNSFDRAPGGSGRQKSHATGRTDSWDLQMKKSITDLLKSPEKTPTLTRPAHETSTFFAERSGDRKAHSFAASGGFGGTPTASDVPKHFSFPSPASKGGNTSTPMDPMSFGFQAHTENKRGNTPAASKNFKSHGPGGVRLDP